ncbi:MAG: response regulator transcription factor [Anaerolineae bacterium]|nr:response regulator transcription factor [Anaerolineae bacterium]
MQAKVLWIESGPANDTFIPTLRKKGYLITIVSTGKGALEKIPVLSPHIVVINAASLRSNGSRICQNIRSSSNGLPILLIANPEHPISDDDVPVNVVLNLPFTPRKLVNRINPLLPQKNSDLLKTGPITLNLEHNLVQCGDKETQLTPRLIQLLKMFLEKPGVVLEREKLFKQVWNTDYIGDTRTLDVHISWLRKAIEEDPRKPELLKTIRGVGYRLDIDVEES